MINVYTQGMNSAKGNTQNSDECVFCAIIAGNEPAEVVLDLNDFLVIKNKYPRAPYHFLVLDKKHREKSDTMAGASSESNYWDSFMQAVSTALQQVPVLKKGEYEIVLNGPSYAHFKHEHIHILGGYEGGSSSRT